MPAERRGAFSFGTGKTSQVTTNTTTTSSSATTISTTRPPNMAFNFGTTSTPTAAPAAPSFGAAPAPGGARPPAFGAAPAPSAFGAAPAPATGGLFGAPSPAPVGLFGAQAQAPAPSAFGAAPASGGLFGSTPSPAPGGFFGASAPAAGGLFGNAPAPAPGGLFGAPAPATGGLFGTPAPAPSAFGAAPQLTIAPAANLAGYMPYSSLPQDQKNNIDAVYQAMMNHKRTILAVSTMAPKLLDVSTQQADVIGGQQLPLPITVRRLTGEVQKLEHQFKSLHNSMMHSKQMYETTTTQAIHYAKWPSEFVATRVGATLTNNNNSNDRNANAATAASSTEEVRKKTEEFNRRLKELLDRETIHADQIVRMPSPYLWQLVEEMERRFLILQNQLQSLKETLDIKNQVSSEEFDVLGIIQLQEKSIWNVAAKITQVHAKVDELRQLYNQNEKGINVLEEAQHQEKKHNYQLGQRMTTLMVKTLPSNPAAAGPAPATAGGLFGTPAPAPVGSLFGNYPAAASGSLFGTPSTGSSLFGSSAPAPTGGSLFGAAPAPATGGLFGAAPAPATGGLFGAAPAPAAGGLFGAVPAPAAIAPATGGLFGAAPAAPTPASGGLFGAPTPATGGLFGATPAPAFGAIPAPAASAFGAAPAPAAGGLFGSTTAAAATPKSKSRSRNGSRRR